MNKAKIIRYLKEKGIYSKWKHNIYYHNLGNISFKNIWHKNCFNGKFYNVFNFAFGWKETKEGYDYWEVQDSKYGTFMLKIEMLRKT